MCAPETSPAAAVGVGRHGSQERGARGPREPAVSPGVAARRGWEGSCWGPRVAFDHWSRLASAPVLRSSCLARGFEVAFAGDLPFPSAEMVHPSLAWRHAEVPVGHGSVPCTSLGWVGGCWQRVPAQEGAQAQGCAWGHWDNRFFLKTLISPRLGGGTCILQPLRGECRKQGRFPPTD